jgi:hypothetical protein
MSQIFISHVEEDESIALEIAHGLEVAGYSTWYYERDSLPGVSYLDQIDEAIEQCQAVVVIISLASLSSWQVDKEVERAHESGKHFVPVLHGVKHVEFQTRKRGWRMAMGVNTSISVPADGASTIVPRIAAGLRRLVINSEAPVSSPPVNGQMVSQDVYLSGLADHLVETGEARLLQSEAIAEQPPLDTTPTVRDVDANAAQIDPARQPAVADQISSERVAARTDRAIPGTPALLRRVITRAAMITLAVLVVLGFAFYGFSKLMLSKSVENSNQAESKKTEPSPGVSGQSQPKPVEQATQPKRIEPAASITGTIWKWERDEVVFKPNGVIGYIRLLDGRVYDSCGHWEQTGNHVKFDLNVGRGDYMPADQKTYFQVVISPDGKTMEGMKRQEHWSGTDASLTKLQ